MVPKPSAAVRAGTSSKANSADLTSHRRSPQSLPGLDRLSQKEPDATVLTSTSIPGTEPTGTLEARRIGLNTGQRLAQTTQPMTPTVVRAAVFSAKGGAASAATFSSTFVKAAQDPAPPTAAPAPGRIASVLASAVADVLSPFADDEPNTPVEAPTLLTLAAFVRREFEQGVSQKPTVNPLAGHITSGLVTAAPALNGEATVAELSATAEPATFTGQPSFLSKAMSAAFGLVATLSEKVGVDLTTPLLQAVSSDSPPPFTTVGLNVERTEFEGMPVWALQSPGSTSDEVVIAVHGGALVVQPPVFNWLFYAGMARDTGATVLVPIYPLVQDGGTAGTVVPAMADLISAQIDARGAENVSVFGDSAGGNIALAAVQEMVRRGDPVPSRMVLSSPGLDSTLSNPAIQFVDDPVLSSAVLATLKQNTDIWADGLDLTDPLLSPLYGSLAGLPPIVVYAGSRDVVAPDVLLLRDKALATPGSDFTFVLREGEFHDWLVIPLLPETQALLPDVYQQLGLVPESALKA